MTLVLIILGLMTCLSLALDLVSDKLRHQKEIGYDGFGNTLLSLLWAILSFVTAPVGLYLTWHDKIKESVFREDYHKSHQQYCELMEKNQKAMESEIAHLKDQIWDERLSRNEEIEEQGWQSGYRIGFRKGLEFCIETLDVSKDSRHALYSNALDVVNFDIKMHKISKESERDEDLK